MYTVYVLYSFVHNKTYTGHTSDLIQRFYSHNIFSKTGWSIKYRPWYLIHCEVFETKTEALQREKLLKSGKGRDWVKVNLDDFIKVFS